MSYALRGKIAGFGAFRGLGDAASDYLLDHAQWLKEKAAYDLAMQGYAASSAGAAASYASALASWNAASAARAAQLQANARQQLSNQQARDQANAAARAQGVVTPAGYPGCVTQAQHNAWQSACATISTTVKGLGADPSGPLCALALLPVCAPPIAMPGPLPPPPSPPAAPRPPPALRPEPQPPPATSAQPSPLPQATTPFQNSPLGPAPVSILQPSSSPAPTPPASKSAGLIKNGLILVVLAGGGYALYRTLRKPRAA